MLRRTTLALHERRVIAWYLRAGSQGKLDLHSLASWLRRRPNVSMIESFKNPSRTHAATGTTHHHHTTTSSSKASSAQVPHQPAAKVPLSQVVQSKPQPFSHHHTPLEVITFSLLSASSTKKGSSSPFAAASRAATFVLLTEGSLVGWNVTWEDMVAVRDLLLMSGTCLFRNSPFDGATDSHQLDGTRTESVLYELFDEYENRNRNGEQEEKESGEEDSDGSAKSSESVGRNAESDDSSVFRTSTTPPAPPWTEKSDIDHGIGASSTSTSADSCGDVAIAAKTEVGATAEDEEDQELSSSPEMLPRNYIDSENDTVVLKDDSIENKIPMSFALTQSIRLEQVNTRIAPITQKVRKWEQRLATDGKIKCGLKELRKTKVQLLTILEGMHIMNGLNTTPTIFWSYEFQPLRSFYWDCCEHLELEERGTSLKHIIETIDSAVSYLDTQLHASTADLLTWVIIWLIVIEVLLAVDTITLCKEALGITVPSKTHAH